MFVNRPYEVKHLFSNLNYIVIDEIHSFVGSDRGIQLKSLISRLYNVSNKRFSIVGLSATIGDYEEAKRFTGNPENTKVLLDKQSKEIQAIFKFFESATDELPVDLLKDLYLETKDNKALIFPNSRGRAEEVAVKLKKISDRVRGHPNYFSHHSSVDKEVREYVEYFAKNNTRQNFCISCTSTLELGIDIGSVDEVVQIDATNSIASLIQRVGRSGRKAGESSNLFLYATNQWSLLQSLACWLLFTEGYIEPLYLSEKPYDILLHQALSITKGHSGIKFPILVNQLKENFAFDKIDELEIEEILSHLIEYNILDIIQNEVIIGIEGEWIVNNREFYNVFKTEENFKVINAGNTIGNIPFSPQIREDENILSKIIEVIPAHDGKKPTFSGGSGIVHPRIREKMLEIVLSTEQFEVLDQPCKDELDKMRKDFSPFENLNSTLNRPVLVKDRELLLFTFTGTRINRTIQMLLKMANIDSTLSDQSSSLEINELTEDFMSAWPTLSTLIKDLDLYLIEVLKSNSSILNFSKWGQYLPQSFQVKLLKDKYFDFENTLQFLSSVQLMTNKRQQ